jgi:hypothetical protein
MNAPVPVFRHHARDKPLASSGTFTGQPFDLHHFRAIFPDQWSQLIRRHFRSTVEVAFFFSVDEKAARNWWNGTTGPSGHAVAIAVRYLPGAIDTIFTEAA